MMKTKLVVTASSPPRILYCRVMMRQGAAKECPLKCREFSFRGLEVQLIPIWLVLKSKLSKILLSQKVLRLIARIGHLLKLLGKSRGWSIQFTRATGIHLITKEINQIKRWLRKGNQLRAGLGAWLAAMTWTHQFLRTRYLIRPTWHSPPKYNSK